MSRWPWILCLLFITGMFAAEPGLAIPVQEQELVKMRIETLPSMIPNGHPRVMLHPDELADFRADFLKSNNMMWKLVLKTKVLPLRLEPTLPQEIKSAQHANNAAATAAWAASMAAAANAGYKTMQFALAYLITGDTWYANQAERLLAHMMSWDMRNMTVQANDEAFVQMLHPLLFAYDWIAPVISAQNKAKIQAGLELRLISLLNLVKTSLSLTDTPMANLSQGSSKGMNSHHVRFVSTLAIGGLALYGETPRAAEVLAWAYEYYVGPFAPWGGADGGWSEGAAYWASAQTHHFNVADAFSALGIHELYDSLWFQNTGFYGLYVVPPYPHASLGDQAAFITPGPAQFYPLRRLAQIKQDPYLARYTELLGQSWSTALAYYSPSMAHTVFAVYRERVQPVPKGKPLSDLPQSHWFKDIHWVAMHSNMEKPKDDVFFLMKSSPYGGYSHSHADQNSFVLTAYGQPLAISSGYREWYGSNHHSNWTRQTKSKNTVLVNGEGQSFAKLAPGAAITEFFTGKLFTVTTGDASPAYSPATLSRYDRRVLSIGGERFIILDELAAPKDSRFDWLLHSRNEMNLGRADQGNIGLQDGTVKLDVRFLYPQADQLSFQQTNKFNPPIDPAYSYAPQWHLTVSNTVKAKEQRFLTVLSPYRTDSIAPAGLKLLQNEGLLGAQRDDLRVLFASGSGEQLGTAADLSFQGRMAAVFATAQQSAWMLHQGTLLVDRDIQLVRASSAISIELAQSAQETPSLYIQNVAAAHIEIHLTAAPQRVNVISGDEGILEWRYHQSTKQLSLDLPAGTWQLTIE